MVTIGILQGTVFWWFLFSSVILDFTLSNAVAGPTEFQSSIKDTEGFSFSLDDTLKILNESSMGIQNIVSDWYSYKYDGSLVPSMIDDGGEDMFDQGNQILVDDDGRQTIEITYNKLYHFDTFDFISSTIYPFVSLLRIENSKATEHQYTLQVSGNAGADGSGFVTEFQGTVEKENFTIVYFVFQISNASDPTICEVYFILHSEKHWLSIKPTSFTLESTGSGTNRMVNAAKISGTPKNLVMGYTLLSRYPTAVISEMEVMKVMLDFMDIFGKMQTGCVLGRQRCHMHADCHNTFDSYKCTCAPGFYGDGVICKDIDECSDGSLSHNCDVAARCVNTAGGFDCVCVDGFHGNGTVCLDVDECSLGGFCHEHATCTNGRGWHSCTCDKGYYGNGTHCAVESRYYSAVDVPLSELHLADYTCRGYVDPFNDDMWVFDIPNFLACGTILTGNSSHLTYSNVISNTIKNNSIYSAAGTFAWFSCVYEKSLQDFSLFTSHYSVIQNVANLTVPFQSGQFLVALNQYTDPTYKHRETKSEFETSDTLYFMVSLQTNDPTLRLVIDSCWVTPSPDVSDSQHFVFIDGQFLKAGVALQLHSRLKSSHSLTTALLFCIARC